MLELVQNVRRTKTNTLHDKDWYSHMGFLKSVGMSLLQTSFLSFRRHRKETTLFLSLSKSCPNVQYSFRQRRQSLHLRLCSCSSTTFFRSTAHQKSWFLIVINSLSQSTFEALMSFSALRSISRRRIIFRQTGNQRI